MVLCKSYIYTFNKYIQIYKNCYLGLLASKSDKQSINHIIVNALFKQ